MIKVIIERKVAEDLEPNYHEAIRTTLKAVLEAPGYMSSESLVDINNIHHKIIITNWTSVQAWQQWYSSDARKQATSNISPMLDGGEKITILETRS